MTTKGITTKERLHHLVDEIPDADAPFVLRMLEGLRTDDEPVLRAFLEAPEDDPLPDELEALADEEDEGHPVPHEEVRREPSGQ